MKKTIAVIVCLVMLIAAASAGAEIYIDRPKPEGWENAVVLRLIVFKAHANDAMILESQGQRMLVDGGVKGFYKKIELALAETGGSHFDYIFNSHPHDDHIGAQERLVSHGIITADAFISMFPPTYRNELQQKMNKALNKAGIPYRQLSEGDILEFGAATIHMLRYAEGSDPNSLSGVMHITAGSSTLLLTADLAGVGQHWMADNYPQEVLKADILKACHHGLTKMVPDFLDKVNPEVVFFTNSHGNTGPESEQVAGRGAVPMWNEGGRITMETDGTDWYIVQEKGVF